MQLKQYQTDTLRILSDYLRALNESKAKEAAARGLGIAYEWDREAWNKIRPNAPYLPSRNGVGEPLPNVCLKVPTGGGKTLLALKAIDLIHGLYLRRQTGLVLWIVPTTQIYNQTYRALRDKAHPYRQVLDMASADRTLIRQKDELFSPEDVDNGLVVLLLMLPSANRQDKETLKVFQDRGGFEAFFPPEDRWQEQRALRERVPNLDAYGGADEPPLMGGALKTSLGNTLRLLRPVIILDEGHKAYGEIAQATLRGFNPAFLLELSATPDPRRSNLLVSISGQAVLREGMIKLPINVASYAGSDWREALLNAHLKRMELEQAARENYERTGDHIRPIMLIQVERTGEKQRLPGFIHAEDARDYLITQCHITPKEIAVKSSEKDEIEDIDLLDPDCPIKYIITKQALQEGWDCAFAYVLATLVNTKAPASMTQLVGRVLRQPYARKTGLPALDESYVYFCKPRTGDLIQKVYQSLKEEGLEDIPGGVKITTGESAAQTERAIQPRYAEHAGKVYLPCFVVPDEVRPGQFREVGYEIDILSRVDFEKISLSDFDTLELNPTPTQGTSVSVGLEGAVSPLRVTTAVEMPLDLVFITRQLLDVVPNPWVAYAIARNVIERLRQRYSEDRLRRDLGFVISELKRTLVKGRNEQAQQAFHDLIQQGRLKFWLIAGCAGNAIPDRIRTRLGPKLRHLDNDDTPQRSLFDYAAEDFNDTEAAVALYLDRQQWVLGWFRNIVKHGYSIQGWQPNRVWPDFVALHGLTKLEKVQVLEIKGWHLKNEDTQYKQQLFELCNTQSQPQLWDHIAQDFADHTVHFQMVFEDEWRRVINALFSPESA